MMYQAKGHFLNWINDGLLRYMNREKTQQWFMTRGLQLPKVRGTTGSSNPNVLYESDFVKNGKSHSLNPGDSSIEKEPAGNPGFLHPKPDATPSGATDSSNPSINGKSPSFKPGDSSVAGDVMKGKPLGRSLPGEARGAERFNVPEVPRNIFGENLAIKDMQTAARQFAIKTYEGKASTIERLDVSSSLIPGGTNSLETSAAPIVQGRPELGIQRPEGSSLSVETKGVEVKPGDDSIEKEFAGSPGSMDSSRNPKPSGATNSSKGIITPNETKLKSEDIRNAVPADWDHTTSKTNAPQSDARQKARQTYAAVVDDLYQVKQVDSLTQGLNADEKAYVLAQVGGETPSRPKQKDMKNAIKSKIIKTGLTVVGMRYIFCIDSWFSSAVKM